ncbi:MAG: tyrosine--tRNA ligase [Phycisphaerales bacterium]|nr:tyrosine--tRNA ligase [Phycisphaerales bacterium]
MAWRGLIHQSTHEAELARHLSTGPRRAYVGFDPTANSLTIGNLMGIMTLRRFQEAGHQPVVVMGGGTGLIGDPSGKSAERQLMTRETVEANVQSQRRIFEALIDFSPEPANRGLLFNNAVWLGRLKYLDTLRDVGKHFTVNAMIQRDSVRERLNNRDQGISYTEFSYMVLQSIDFAHLYRKHGVTLQMGGSDQYGNILSGVDLLQAEGLQLWREAYAISKDAESLFQQGKDEVASERMADASALWRKFQKIAKSGATPRASFELPTSVRPQNKWLDRFRNLHLLGDIAHKWNAFGLTWPLVTKADGTKFGKTESGAIWLTADRTSPYEYFQFWLNAADGDVIRFLKFFTLLPHDRIADLEASMQKDPAAREAQRALAREATTLLHGKTEADNAEAAAKALFSGEIAGLPEATLRQVLGNVPSSRLAKSRLDGAGVPLLDLLIETHLASSKREAREFLASGSVAVNGRKASTDESIKASDLLHGRLLAIRRGKKHWHLTEWE